MNKSLCGIVMLSVVVNASIFYFSAPNFSHFQKKNSNFAILRYDIKNCLFCE